MTVLKLLLVASLIVISSCEVEKIINNNKPNQSKMIKQNQNIDSKLFNQIIIGFGILFVIAEIIVWRKQIREQSLITFAVFNKDLQELPSHTNSHNDFSSGKHQGIQEVISKDQSPGIKTIKAMTQNSGEEKDVRKKRRRKADKLSDRRSDRNDQQQEAQN